MAAIAKVLTFHLPPEQVTSLLEIFDSDLAPQYTGHRGFRGLLCLEVAAGASRRQIYVVSLWEEDGNVGDAEDLADRWWDDTSDALGVGIARQRYRVLRDISGQAPTRS